MSNNFSQNYAPEIVGGAVEVAGHLIGKNLIDSLRRSFTFSSQVQLGDYFMDRSRVLLQNHLQLLGLRERDSIHQNYQKLRKAQQALNSHNGSQIQKIIQARKYRRISNETYKIIKAASDRAIDDTLMNQILEGIHPPGGGSGSGLGTGTVASNPFSNSHAISTLTDMSVNSVDRVEMSTYHVDNTDEAAVVVNVVGHDESFQHVVATFHSSGDRTDKDDSQSNVPAALSLHDQDGTVLGLVTESLPDITSDRQRENEEV